MMLFNVVWIITGIAVALCGLAFPLWIFGIPGIENDYARGWTMGLSVILTYPIVWFINYIFYLVVQNRLSESRRHRLQIAVIVIAIANFLVAIVRMVQAFRLILSA